VRALSEPSRLAAAVFLLLVAATIAAFFAAQRLKSEKPLLRYRASDRAFSPNGDGVKDAARIRFKLPEADDLTVTILDEDGGAVARVARNKHFPQGETTVLWNGRGDDGVVAPEGTYDVRVGLRRQGRTNTLPHEIELDVTAPRPRIRAVDGPGRGPIVIDRNRRRTAAAQVPRSARSPRFSVWRTDLPRARKVVDRLPAAGSRRRARWNGRVRGRPAPAGTYLIAADVLDRAGNRGSIPFRLPPPGTGDIRGGVGVTVRPLAVTPPLAPVAPGTRVRVAVDAGARRYDWALRRVTGERVGRGRSRARRLALRMPDGPGGTYLLTVRTRRDVARAAIPVAAPRARPVLVVLPALTWQGRNDVDDNGDGLPDSLARGRTARLDRPFARGRLPVGFRSGEARVLAYLDRQRLRYELTTDLALAREAGAPLAQHRAVILAGESRWLPQQLGDRLERFVRRGGRLLSIGADSLQRTLALGARDMSDPSERAPTDFFGARLARPVRETTGLLAQSDRINVFSGTAGSLGTWEAWEETRDLGRGRMLATAVADGGEEVFVAYRLGRGLVVRPGVRGWGRALDDDVAPPGATMRRIWTLLRR
jgi:hypothetical protein